MSVWSQTALYNPISINNAKKRKKKIAKKRATKACETPEMQAQIQKRASQIAYTLARNQLRKDGVKIDQQTGKEYRIESQRTFVQAPTYRKGMQGKDFYITRQWRELRYQALKNHGPKCQCCGEVHGYMHVDHIKPRSKFPELELELDNLQILCEACNIGKSNKDQTDWR